MLYRIQVTKGKFGLAQTP